MLHFAYGANMDRAVMRRYARHAEPLGTATLADHRFLITGDGYGSVEPISGAKVHGVLWRLTAADRVSLDLFENIAAGRYRAAMLPVHRDGRRSALVYIARPRGVGRPKPGYMELVLGAARAWRLPQDYIDTLQEWVPPAQGTPARKFLGVFG
jgi:gamma-glutamylcyclotransferase (GGCT)/AIG2-like uncharacterized protein YtfP